ncbi:WW domain-containing protein wwm1 [Ascochyta clinopodiicola]|nr:WW domain-containing protein wwm1 [Ascochyta clinopodiicola]
MADFAPPPGPPPPKVPEGWKAVWNDQYHEWFFVNIYTKQSTWEKPTEPVYPPGEAPHGGPPAYGGAASSHPTGTSEKSTFSSNNPYGSQQPGISEDEKLARRLQEEEQTRAGRLSGDANHGARNDYYGSQQGGYGATGPSIAGQAGGYPQPGGYSQQQYQTPATSYQQEEKSQSKGKGLLGKLLGKASGSSSHPQQSYGQGGYAGGYGGQGMYQQRPGYAMPAGRRPGGGGMGMGGVAMGAGAGLLGGAMLGSALGDAGDGGGDYGGDGGDMGGDGGGFDDGGGDFGGGDF